MYKEFPPLGSRCAGFDCYEIPTHRYPLSYDYGNYILQHELYYCGEHYTRAMKDTHVKK